MAEHADKVPALVEGIKGLADDNRLGLADDNRLGLADDNRLGLAIALAEGGRMTFAEIREKYGLSPDTLGGHLSALQKGNLVRNYYEKHIGSAHSYYEATDLSEAVPGALFAAAQRPKASEGRPMSAG